MNLLSELINFLMSVLVELAVIAVVSLSSFLLRSRIIFFAYHVIHWLFNAEVHLSAKRIDRIPVLEDEEPELNIDYPIFEQLQDRYTGKLTDPDYSSNKLSLKVEGLPTRVNIRLEKRVGPGQRTSDPTGYKVLIETDSEIRMGYRSVEALRVFENFSDTASRVILRERFNSAVPEDSIAICQMTKGVPAGISEISDDDLHIAGHVTDSVLHLTFKEPYNLTEGVKKYFSPT